MIFSFAGDISGRETDNLLGNGQAVSGLVKLELKIPEKDLYL